MAKASEFLLLDTAELGSRLAENKRELFNLRFQLATGQLDNTARMGQVKKDIARIFTVARQRDLDEFNEAYAQATAALLADEGALVSHDEIDADVDVDIDDDVDVDVNDETEQIDEEEEVT